MAEPSRSSRPPLLGAGVLTLAGLAILVVALFLAGPLARRDGTIPGASQDASASGQVTAGASAAPGASTVPSGASIPTSPSAAPTAAAITHVFVVIMENQDYTKVYGSSKTPYVNMLADGYARADNYDAVEHPSLGNYLDILGGTSTGTSSDCSPSDSCHVTSPAVVDLLEAAGLSWKGYFEAMGTPCRLTDAASEDYEAHHNPFVYFDSIRTDAARCAAHDVDYGQLATDLASADTTPNFALVIPSGPTHNGSHSISGGDEWLSQNLPPMLSSPACTQERCLLVLTWDEDDYNGRNQVLTIFAGSGAREGYVSDEAYTHFSLLRTIESIFDVGTLTDNDGAAAAMSDMLR